MRTLLSFLGLAGLLWTVSACQASVATLTLSAAPTRAGSFAPYQTITPTSSQTPSLATPPTPTLVPTATATPRTYTVKAGDDMSGIALRFRVPLDVLRTANPEVNPRLMKIGTVLIIPGTAPAPANQPAAPTLTATVQPVAVQAPRCHPDQTGGAWCFAQASQSTNAPVFNLVVSLRLLDETGKPVSKQNASVGLDLLPSGVALPVMAYFPAPLPVKYQVDAQVTTALPAQLAADRYAAAQLRGLKTSISDGEISAQVSGEVVLPDAKTPAGQLHLLLVAYDSTGQVAGVRRYDDIQPPAPGQAASFSVWVYSLGPKISRVEAYVEAVKA